MRLGINPQKEQKKIKLTVNHRVIVVVYIPDEAGFHKNSFNVFKLCLDSIIVTVGSNALITVVNNGSHQKVSDFLNDYFNEKRIDTLISHTANIGKIDASIGAARGCREKYITLTDADILFARGWQEKTEEIFFKFKNVGSVSPIPVRSGLFYGSSSVLKQILLKRLKLTYRAIPENFTDYNRYMESINWATDTNENEKWPIVQSNGAKAIVGSGHQVLTIDRDILFQTVPTAPSLTLVGSNSEYLFVDVPIDKSGKLRLSTYNNYAFHMGNQLESWMENIQEANKANDLVFEKENYPIEESTDLFNSKMRNVNYQIKKQIIKRIFSFFIHRN